MAFKLLDAVTGTGASTAITMRKINEDHSIQINITGTPTAVTVTLEGSLDGVLFSTILTTAMSAGELTATTALAHIADKPLRFVRANLTVLTGGSSPTVTVLYEPQEHRK